MRWVVSVLMLLLASAGAAQGAGDDPFAQTVQWSAVESWNRDALVYTFTPDGKFRSSDWDGGKGQGTWTRDGQSLVMTWPGYGAIYRGSIGGDEIRGTAYGRAAPN